MNRAPVGMAFVIACSLAACHHGSGTPGFTTGTGSTVGDQLPFPAFQPDAPQVVSLGGPVMTSPQAVAITFPNDALVGDIETFVSTIGATDYWNLTTSEYGVAPLTAATPIRLTEAAPASLTDTDIQVWLRDKLDGTHPEFPAPGLGVLYTIFYPQSTSIDQGGSKSCQSFGGYHNSTVLTNGTPIVYAVIPRCASQGLGQATTSLQTLTITASHELIEAATDPQPLDNPAYLQVDDNHYVYARLTGGGGEVGDMCEVYADAAFVPAQSPGGDHGFAFTVQRTWSNVAAATGAEPCVPAASAGPYFNTTPRSAPDSLTMTGFQGDISTEGWIIPVGTSRTVVFGLYSSNPTGDPIVLKAIDLSAQRTGRAPTLQFSFDQNSGFNGQSVSLTITALAASTSRSGVTSFEVQSSVGQGGSQVTHAWLSVVQAQ